MRTRVRLLGTALVVVSLVVVSLDLGSAAAAEPTGTGVHYPVDSKWNSDYAAVERLITQEDWETAADRLIGILERLQSSEKKRAPSTDGDQSDGDLAEKTPAEQRNSTRRDAGKLTDASVVTSGGGYAVGTGVATHRLLRILPAEFQKRVVRAVEPTLEELWRRRMRSESEAELGAFRRALIRDFPWSRTAQRAAAAELDLSLSRGDLRRAQTLCAFVEKHDASSNTAKIRATLLLSRIARLSGDDAVWKRTRELLLEGLVSLSGGDATLRRSVEGELASPFTRPTPVAARAPLLSPLDVSRAHEVALALAPTSEFELGSVQSRQRFELSELLGQLSNRIPPPLPVVSPTLVRATSDEESTGNPEGETPGKTPAEGDQSAAPSAGAGATSTQRALSDRAPSGRGDSVDFPLPFFPISKGDSVYLQTYEKLFAFDLPSLKQRWSTPMDRGAFETLGSLRAPAINRKLMMATAGDGAICVDRVTGEVLWRRLITYARRTKRVHVYDPENPPPLFAMNDAGVAQNLAAPGDGDGDDDKGDDDDSDAEDPAAEAGESEDDGGAAAAGDKAPRLDEDDLLPFVPSSLTPAIPYEDGFLVGAAVRVDAEILTYVISVDGAGDPAWITYTGSTQSTDFLGMGSTLSPLHIAAGRVYLATNLGFVATLDPDDGEILWMRAYGTLSSGGKIRSIEDWDRWQPNPLLYWKGQILIAPQDANSLIALDASNGSILWRLPRDRHTTILGATDRACILGGPQVTALELEDAGRRGSVLWRWQPPGASLISVGRALIANGRVFVSDLNALYSLDLTTGEQRSVALWDFRGGGGNLLLVPGNLLCVASAGEFLVYNHREDERRRLARLPAGSQERLLETAKLELKNGRVEAGLVDLEAWAERRFPAAAPNSSLDRLLFEISETLRYTVDLRGENDPSAGDLLRLLHRTERIPEYRAVAAFRAGAAYLSQRRFQDAVLVVGAALGQRLGEASCAVNEFLTIPGHILAEGVLAAVRDSGAKGAAAFTNFEFEAQEALARARQHGTQKDFEDVVRGFPLTRASATAHLELARYFQDQQNLNEAIRWLLNYLAGFPDADDYTQVALRAANHFAELRWFAEARDLLLALKERRPDDDIPSERDAGRTLTVKTYVERRLGEPGFQELEFPVKGRWLRFPLQLLWRSPANLLTLRRDFLDVKGPVPDQLEGHFLTVSRDVVECYQLETGVRRWRVEFSMVPGFKASGEYSRFRKKPWAFFVGDQPVGDRLVFIDQNNILCTDTRNGQSMWTKTFDAAKRTKEKAAFRARLGDRIVGAAADQSRVFVRTQQNRLLCFDVDGNEVFATRLAFGNTRYKGDPIPLADGLMLVRQGPLQAVFYDTNDGRETLTLDGSTEYPDLDLTLKETRQLSNGTVLLLTGHDLVRIDPTNRRFLSRYRVEEELEEFEKLWTFPTYPDQVVVSTFNKKKKQRTLRGISPSKGVELWRYGEFKQNTNAAYLKPLVYPDDTRLYVLYGSETRYLTAIDVREGPDLDEFSAVDMWPEHVNVGLRFGDNADVLVTQDSLILPDAMVNRLTVYDKLTGTDRRTTELQNFLVDKRPGLQCRVEDGVLIVLTDRGDAGFTSQRKRLDLGSATERAARLKRYLTDPTDWENVIWLALHFFQHENGQAALDMLNRALLSEKLPSLESPGMYQKLRHIFDGIKEEAVKEDGGPESRIVCRRFRVPPTIDGELRESWNVSQRKSLSDLRAVNLIPTTGQENDIWKGKEDLSADIYTGWDARYFYFAIDVQDNRIFPYDKEAEYWKGDCLVIGLDPEGDGGLIHSGHDQLLTLALTIPKRRADDDEEDEGDEEDGEGEGKKPKGRYSVKKKEDDSGVVYEAAIPWESFGPDVTPEPGKRFGLSLVVTDDDTGQGATKMMSIRPCHLIPRDQVSRSIWRHLIPEYFPKVTLD